MNQPVLLHIVERLESFVGKLPETIQKPILSELTPLKELFLQQRPPRFLFVGSTKKSAHELMHMFFGLTKEEQAANLSMPVYHWQDADIGGRGTTSILDARGAVDSADREIRDELNRQPADIVFFIDEGEGPRGPRQGEIENLIACLNWNDYARADAKVIGILIPKRSSEPERNADSSVRALRLHAALQSKPAIRDRLLQTLTLSSAEETGNNAQELMSILGRELPNQARIEMIRISHDREAQREVAQVLVKSTTAICAAIGAQPIPLADLPILTMLQLVMVSGIMYLSGRERSLRAATEFIGAIGANVGAGMLFREGTRALLKFLPGWGNVICGMVAGAGTYAIGRAATAFFLEGVSLKDARRAYRAGRKKSVRPALPVSKRQVTGHTRGK